MLQRAHVTGPVVSSIILFRNEKLLEESLNEVRVRVRVRVRCLLTLIPFSSRLVFVVVLIVLAPHHTS